MSNAIVDNGVISNASYGDFTKNMSATDHIKALTDNRISKPGMTTEQAEALAGAGKDRSNHQRGRAVTETKTS